MRTIISYNLVTDNLLATSFDNSSFWDFNYNVIMITDTVFLRNLNSLVLSDTPDILNYKNMQEMVNMVVREVKEFFKT